MWTRRHFLARSSATVLGLAGTALGLTNQTNETIPDGSQARGMVTEATDRAIERGLSFLETNQWPDGSFGTGLYERNVAVTSLAALAFMSGGYLPGRGRRGQPITRALNYVLSREDTGQGNPHFRGFLHNQGEHGRTGPMYGHGFGTLFLAEVHGMVDDPQLAANTRATLQRAVDLILRSQHPGGDGEKERHKGGWRYMPYSTDSDISVTICQIMALRAARNAGVFVPKDKVDLCVHYVKSCQDTRDGYFRYQARERSFDNQHFARTAAGLAALYAAGIYKGPEVDLALNFLMTNHKPQGNYPAVPTLYYFYGHYYAAQAMWTAGGHYWAEWFPAIRDELVKGQGRDGCWLDQCRHYATAMACIILQIPDNYLPILQK